VRTYEELYDAVQRVIDVTVQPRTWNADDERGRANAAGYNAALWAVRQALGPCRWDPAIRAEETEAPT